MKAITSVVGLVIAAAIWQFRAHFPFDDTFISFRYAEHVASGHGLVWNVGGPHTEGFTNLLFVLLLAAARLVTSDLLVASQLIGLISTMATGLILYSIVSEARDKQTGLLAVAFYWATPLTWINAMSGMETSLFVMLCALAILLTVRKRFLAAYAVVFLATLTRPEGALLGLILFVVNLFSSRANHKPLQKSFYTFFIAFVVPMVLYALWKWWYFGELLPNSFYVKVIAGSHGIFPGLQYVRLFVSSVLALVALSFGIRGWRNPVLMISALWPLSLLAFYLFVLPLEGLYDRFLWPAFSMLCMIAAIGARDFSTRRKLSPFVIFAIIALGMHFTLTMLSPRTKQSLDAHEEIWDASMDRIVNELRQLPHFDSLRLAYGDAGYVVYKSGIQHIDLFGLNDTRIAHALSVPQREAIVQSEAADILLLPIYSRDSCEDFVEDAYGLARAKGFEPVASTGAFPFRLVWLLNIRSPYYSDCRREIFQRIKDSAGMSDHPSALDPAPMMCYSTR